MDKNSAKRPYWMNNVQTEALDDIFTLLINQYNNILFNKSPIIISHDEIDASNDNEYVQSLCNQLSQKAQLPLQLKTEITDDSNPVFRDRITAIAPIPSKEETTLFVKKSLTADAPKLLAEMAHAIALTLLENENKTNTSDPLEKEAIADILAILFGYGIIICNTREWKEENICSCGLWHSKVFIGFINIEEACYIQGKMTMHYGEKFSVYKKFLLPNPKQFIKQSIKYLKKNQRELS